MQLEAVGRVSVRDLRLEVRRQVDDVDGSKWTLLDADTASYAETFGDEGDLGFGCDFDAELSGSYNRT